MGLEVEFVKSPIESKLIQIIVEAKNVLFVATPFIKDYGIETILNNANCESLKILTNLDLVNLCGLGYDIESLLKLWSKFDVRVSSLGKLHAKAYIADDKIAFLTSANLTRGGLSENYEYGVILRDSELVKVMVGDMNKYFNLGNIFDKGTIEVIKNDVVEIRETREKIEQNRQLKKLNRFLKQKEEALQTKILRNRVKGKTINAIFAETIRYLLETKGPLSTREMHFFIRNIHPDICDDSVDRVINGQHFGKKWKHLVRNAQQYLKRNGSIYLEQGKWHLV